MKKILISISIFLGLILTVLIAGLLSISSIVTPDFIVSQIESSLNTRADLKKVNISLFSAMSSIELEGLSLHERDQFADNANLLAERTASASPVLSVRKVDLKLNFVALLRRSFQLKSFLLIEPFVSITLKENGNSLTHLFKKPKLVAGKPNPALEVKEEVSSADNINKPFTVKSLPISANIAKVGMENGTINIFIQKTLQKLSLKNVNLLLTDIDIDPENLEKHNTLHLIANINTSVLNSGGQETALFKIISKGSIVPFVAKTGLINPSVNYNLTLKAGSYINGLSIMDALSGTLPVLSNAGIKLDGFSKKADLSSDVNIIINYFSNKITLLNQITIPTPNYDLTLEKNNWVHLETNEHYFKGGVLASKAESDKAISGVDSAIKTQLKIENPAEIRNKILGNLIKEERVNLPFTSNGNIKSPNVSLMIELPSLLEFGKGILIDKAKEEIKKKLPAGVNDAINQGLKKLF